MQYILLVSKTHSHWIMDSMVYVIMEERTVQEHCRYYPMTQHHPYLNGMHKGRGVSVAVMALNVYNKKKGK